MQTKTKYIIVISVTVVMTFFLAYCEKYTEVGKRLSNTMQHCGGTILTISDCENYLQSNHQ